MAYNYPTKKTSYEAFPETRDFVLAVAKGDYASAKKKYDYLVEKGWQTRHIYNSYNDADYFDNVLDQYRLSPEEYNSIYEDSGLTAYNSGGGANRTGYWYPHVMATYYKLAEADAQKNTKEAEERNATIQSAIKTAESRRNLDGSASGNPRIPGSDSSQVMLTGRDRGKQTMLTRGYQRRTLMGGG